MLKNFRSTPSAEKAHLFICLTPKIENQQSRLFIRNYTWRPESVLSLFNQTCTHTNTHTHAHNQTRPIRHIPPPCVENEAEGSGLTESWLAVPRRRRQDSGTIYHTTALSTKTQREAQAIYIVHLRRRQMKCSFMAHPAESELGNRAGGL